MGQSRLEKKVYSINVYHYLVGNHSVVYYYYFFLVGMSDSGSGHTGFASVQDTTLTIVQCQRNVPRPNVKGPINRFDYLPSLLEILTKTKHCLLTPDTLYERCYSTTAAR